MGRNHKKSADGKYHIGDGSYPTLVGSRSQVWHVTAYKTAWGLTKKNLFQNKRGRIVSRKKHDTARKEKRLERHGFYAKKGKFGWVKGTPLRSAKKRSSQSKSKSKSASAEEPAWLSNAAQHLRRTK